MEALVQWGVNSKGRGQQKRSVVFQSHVWLGEDLKVIALTQIWLNNGEMGVKGVMPGSLLLGAK